MAPGSTDRHSTDRPATARDASGYGEHDSERLLAEPPKVAALPGADAQTRTPFARDRARVLHSAALRRLAGKTQVVGPGEGDVPRTRLTHSLEVAQIGRGIAADLGADPDVVDTAGLAHDIGHPPFGHNGEQALDGIAAECGGFEGNAQTLRILTRLEPKLVDADGVGHGLNLTRAVLDAATKYPWTRRGERGKFGVYADDMPAFTWMRRGAPEQRRCLEAQIMDWADDVAYSVHDVEDGVISGRISLRALIRPEARSEIVRMAATHFGHGADTADPTSLLDAAVTDLVALPAVAAVLDYDGSLSAQVALKRLTSELVGRYVTAAVSGTRARFGDGPLSRYAADLCPPDRAMAEVAVLKAVALRYVMSDPQRLRLQERQRAMLVELVEALVERAPGALDPASRDSWQAADSDHGRVRVVLDQVSALTDAQAVAWHERCVTTRSFAV